MSEAEFVRGRDVQKPHGDSRSITKTRASYKQYISQNWICLFPVFRNRHILQYASKKKRKSLTDDAFIILVGLYLNGEKFSHLYNHQLSAETAIA